MAAADIADPTPELEPVPKSEILLDEQVTEEASNGTDPEPEPVSKPQTIYRCKKCRRIVATQETEVSHERGSGWGRRGDSELEQEPIECTSIFVEPMNWMEKVQEGYVGQKLQCLGCKARLGAFNWAGMQCNCGTWVTPAFQLHKCRLDECRM